MKLETVLLALFLVVAALFALPLFGLWLLSLIVPGVVFTLGTWCAALALLMLVVSLSLKID